MSLIERITNLFGHKSILCSDCFEDEGLRLEAERIGRMTKGRCPNCDSLVGLSLDKSNLEELREQFFSRSTASHQYQVGVAIFGITNDDRSEDEEIKMRPETERDWLLIKNKIGGRLFRRSPRLFYWA
jgi:hypothetical protein